MTNSVKVVITIIDEGKTHPHDYRAKFIRNDNNEYGVFIHPFVINHHLDKFVDSVLYVINKNLKSFEIELVISNKTKNRIEYDEIIDTIDEINKNKYNLNIKHIYIPKDKQSVQNIENDKSDDENDSDDFWSMVVNKANNIINSQIEEDEDDEEDYDDIDDEIEEYINDEDDEEDKPKRKKTKYKYSPNFRSSKAVKNKKMKQSIKKHDIIIYKGKNGKNIKKRDEEVFKKVIGKLYPGDQKYMKKFRKHLLERIMKNVMISKKDFDKLIMMNERKHKQSKNKKTTVVNGINLGASYSAFSDPNK